MRQRLVLRAGALAAIALFASAAIADPATGTRLEGKPAVGAMVWSDISSNAANADDKKVGAATVFARKVAGCMVRMHAIEATAYLRTPNPTELNAKAAKAFNEKLSDCMSYYMGTYGSLRIEIPQSLLQGLIAEAFLHQWPKPILPAVTTMRDGYTAPWMSADPSTQLVQSMSACIAERHPAEALDLLASPMNSKSESDAISRLMPYVTECLQKGATLQTDRTGLRASIALGIYHRIVEATSPPGVAGKAN